MLDVLKTHFGYDTFRPLQKEIIDTVLAGNNSLVLMPTGGGKSLCYQLPALALPGLTLVVSPLIALMKDQVDALRANGISAAFLNSSLTSKEQDRVMEWAREGDLKLLYVAPERIESFGFSDFLDSIEVSLLAIDEAHCISQWGHDFRPDYRNLDKLRRKLHGVPVIALTATATVPVRKDILGQLMMPKAQVFTSSFNRENLHYSVRPKFNGVAQLVELLEGHKGEPAIVYCFSRKNTEEIAKALCGAGLPAVAYHAGLDKRERMRAQEAFIRDKTPIIVATIAFGMGIDKPDVRLVVHMDLPKTIEGYYQETGRAGRDGLPSDCVLLYSYGDKRKQDFFIQQITDTQEHALATRKLEDVILYCQSDVCRRFILLTYFGETDAQVSCEACDNCTEPDTEPVDATEISQKILSAILRTGERFGAAHVCDVLRGSRKKRVLELRHDELSVHGIASKIPAGALRAYTYALTKAGYLAQSEGEYPTLAVTTMGKQALVGKDMIFLPVEEVVAQKRIAKARRSKTDLDYDVELFEHLRVLRKQIADEQDVPPFVIFGDRTLFEMAYYIPSTLETLGQLFGVGAKKLEAFGERFLGGIAQEAERRGLQERTAPERVRRAPAVKSAGLTGTLLETKALVEQGMTVEQMAQHRGLSLGTIVQHVEKLVRAQEDLDIAALKPQSEKFEAMEAGFKGARGSSLTAVFRFLEEKYSYDELRLARIFLSQ